MYIYQITNLINGKIYIGQTNNITKRWANHKCSNSPNMPIARAIKKYGVDNFSFEVLYQNISIEEIDELERKIIIEKDCRVPKGYNVAIGGHKHTDVHKYGADNSNAHLTEDEARYILTHRNIPMYVLYSDFSDKISYCQFKKIYHHQVYKNIKEEVEEYPNNFEFSNQFTSRYGPIMEYDEVIDIRQRYANGEYWREAYEKYKTKYTNEWSFYQAYNGYTYKLVMPEVFTKANKKLHSSLCKSGSRNGRAKLTAEDVKQLRLLYQKGTPLNELYEMFPFVTPNSIRYAIHYKTWTKLV